MEITSFIGVSSGKVFPLNAATGKYHQHVKQSRNDMFRVKFKNRLSAMAEPAKSRLADEDPMRPPENTPYGSPQIP